MDEDPFGDDFLASVASNDDAETRDDPFRSPQRRRKRRKSGRSESVAGGLESTGTGLLVMAWSALAAPVALPFIVALLTADQPPVGVHLYIGFIVVTGLGFLAGELICLFTVPDTTAKVLLTVSLFCQAGETWFNIARIHDPPNAPNLPRIVMRAICAVAMGIALQLFLRRVAIIAKLDEIADQARSVLVLLGVTLGAIVGRKARHRCHPSLAAIGMLTSWLRRVRLAPDGVCLCQTTGRGPRHGR